jgi:ABC-2 type transport system permease protein
MSKALLKYVEVGRTTVRSNWTYVWDQLLGSWFLAVVMFVFVQLWKTTYGAGGQAAIEGYTLKEMNWYLVATEGLILSFPRIHWVIEQEVKDGDLALRLNKPYSYLLFHYSAYIGGGLQKLLFTFGVGGLTAYLCVGGFPFRWALLPLYLLVYLITASLNFVFTAPIGLAAFWMEDVAGLFFIMDKLKWILGGLLLPPEVYPDRIRSLVEALPFRHMIAGPARLFVKFAWPDAVQLMQSQLLWLILFGLACFGIYRLGVRRVDVNGG